MNFAATIAISLVGAGLLSLFFSAVQSEWPQDYASARSVLDAEVRSDGPRYFFFRTIPVFVVALFVSVTVERLGGSALVAIIVMLALHYGLTNGRAVVKTISSGSGQGRRTSIIAYHAGTLILGVVVALAAYFGREVLATIVPTPSDLVLALWVGVFVAVITITVRRLSSFERTPALRGAREDVGDSAWSYATQAAQRFDCDPILLAAIISTEAVQRPRWIRKAERVKGKFAKSGSYGVAQMSSDHPLSDCESIDLLAESFAGYFPPRHPRSSYVLYARLAERLERHNRGRAFIDQTITNYRELLPYPLYSSTARSRDGRPTIEVQEIVRIDSEWSMSGTASVFEANILILIKSDGGHMDTAFVTTSMGAPGRGEWRTLVPLKAVSVQFSEESMEEDSKEGFSARTVVVDLLDHSTISH